MCVGCVWNINDFTLCYDYLIYSQETIIVVALSKDGEHWYESDCIMENNDDKVTDGATNFHGSLSPVCRWGL